MVAPRAERPYMPGYGINKDTKDVLPWRWAVDVLNRARIPVLSTVRPDGRPHAMPLWGLWLGDVYCLSTAITSVKSNNLKANDRCVVTTEDGDDAVIVEGRAELSELPTGFTEAYRLKYGQTIDAGPIWIVRPTVAFAFQATDDFPKTATRWVFST